MERNMDSLDVSDQGDPKSPHMNEIYEDEERMVEVRETGYEDEERMVEVRETGYEDEERMVEVRETGYKDEERMVEVRETGYDDNCNGFESNTEGSENIANIEPVTGTSVAKNSVEDSALLQKLAWLETCILCDTRVADQRALKCEHSFCINCLNEQTEGNAIKCFNCSEVTELSTDGIMALQPNIAVCVFRMLIENMRKRNNNPENLTCDFCKINNTMSYCSNCDKNMCSSCQSRHGKISQFATHMVRQLSELKEGLLRKQVVKCDSHLSEDVAYMCTQCLQLLCPVCVHFGSCGRDHEDKIKDIKKLLKCNRQLTRKKIQQINTNIQALKEFYQSAIQSQEEVQVTKNEILEHHQKVVDELLKKVAEKKKSLVTEVEKVEQKIQVRQAELETQWKMFERRACQVEQWQHAMEDSNAGDLISDITFSHLQYRFESMEVHMVSVQKEFNKLKPVKVTFEPKKGEEVGHVLVGVAPVSCTLPEPINTDRSVTWVQNTEYQSIDEIQAEDQEDQKEDELQPEIHMISNDVYNLPETSTSPLQKARDSIAGLVVSRYADRPQVDMSATPLGKPVKLTDPKLTSSAIFVDIDRLAVADAAKNTISIHTIISKVAIKSRRFVEANGLKALTMHGDDLIAVDNDLKLFVINPKKLSYRMEEIPNTENNSKVGDIATLPDGRIIVSQTSPFPRILCLDAGFKVTACWSLLSGNMPAYMASDERGHVIVVDSQQMFITVYNIHESEGLVTNREIADLHQPRGLCTIDGFTYIIHYDPRSRSDWVLKLDNYVSMTWSEEKIKKYGKAITVTASEYYFVILAERAFEVYSRTDMNYEDEAASLCLPQAT